MTPSSVEAGLIARLLVDPSAIPLLALEPSDFSVDLYGRAWETMSRLHTEGKVIDSVTLLHAGVDLDDIVLRHPTMGASEAVEDYARIIRIEAFRRRAKASLREAERKIAIAPDEAGIIEGIHGGVGAILAETRVAEPVSLADAAARYRPSSGGLSWGLAVLDEGMQPARGGDDIILAAHTSHGKTVTGMHIAEVWASQGQGRVLFFSLEMSRDQLVARRAKQGLDRVPVGLLIVDEGRITTTVIRQQAARLRLRDGRVGALVVDYLQLLGDRGDNSYSRLSGISRELKLIAREFDCPLLALSQLNRNAAREKRRPRLDDIRDSGAIEEDADIAFLLWRESRDDPELLLSIAKNRHGRADWEVTLDFDMEHMRVSG